MEYTFKLWELIVIDFALVFLGAWAGITYAYGELKVEMRQNIQREVYKRITKNMLEGKL